MIKRDVYTTDTMDGTYARNKLHLGLRMQRGWTYWTYYSTLRPKRSSSSDNHSSSTSDTVDQIKYCGPYSSESISVSVALNVHVCVILRVMPITSIIFTLTTKSIFNVYEIACFTEDFFLLIKLKIEYLFCNKYFIAHLHLLRLCMLPR